MARKKPEGTEAPRKHAFQFRTDIDDETNIAQIQASYGLTTQVEAVKMALHFFARASLPRIPKNRDAVH